MRSSVTARGRCSRPRWRPRPPPTSSGTRTRSTSTATASWSATATTNRGRWSPRPARSPCASPGSTTGAPMRPRVSGSGFASAILPAWARKSPQLAEVLPLLYLHGLSSSDFGPALEQFLGTGAGLSAKTITRLTEQWQAEAVAFNQRSLAETDYVYVWVDGIHLKVRLTQDKVCLLVMVGVRADGTKELIALDDGHRESTESWAELLRSCKRRRHDRPGARRRRRRAGVLACAARRVSRDSRAVVLVATRSATCSPRCTRTPRPPSPRSTTPRTASTPRPPRGRSPLPTARSGPRRARRSPRTSTCCSPSTTSRPSTGSTCARPTHRVHLRHRPAPSARHQGTRFASGGHRDGVQAHRVRATPLARGQRPPPRGPRPCRRHLRARPDRRTTRRIRRPPTRRMTRQSTGLDNYSPDDGVYEFTAPSGLPPCPPGRTGSSAPIGMTATSVKASWRVAAGNPVDQLIASELCRSTRKALLGCAVRRPRMSPPSSDVRARTSG